METPSFLGSGSLGRWRGVVDRLDPRSCFLSIVLALVEFGDGRFEEDENLDGKLFPNKVEGPDGSKSDERLDLTSPVNFALFASSSLSALASLNNLSASLFVSSSSSTSFSSSGNPYLPFIASSASRFRFSTFLSERKKARARAEWVNGSEL